MSKKRDQKRKEVLSVKAKDESFKFQVWWNRNKRGLDIPDDDPLVNKELGVICEKGLTDGLLALAEVLDAIRNKLGREQVPDRCSLNGSAVAYILGITPIIPAGAQCGNSPLADVGNVNPPLQVDIYYDADCRNEVVEWVKEHYQGMTSRLGQPALKLHNVVAVFKRVVKL